MDLAEIKILRDKLEKDIADQLNLFQECTHCQIINAHIQFPHYRTVDCKGETPVPVDFHIHLTV